MLKTLLGFRCVQAPKITYVSESNNIVGGEKSQLQKSVVILLEGKRLGDGRVQLFADRAFAVGASVEDQHAAQVVIPYERLHASAQIILLLGSLLQLGLSES